MELFKDVEPREEVITVVSGLPRSGTSMVMQMLKAAGLEPLTDGERTADEDIPNGYFEFEAAKQLMNDHPDWLEQAQGKVIKLVGAADSLFAAWLQVPRALYGTRHSGSHHFAA